MSDWLPFHFNLEPISCSAINLISSQYTDCIFLASPWRAGPDGELSQPPRSVAHQLIVSLGNQNNLVLRCNTSLELLSLEILDGKLVTPVVPVWRLAPLLSRLVWAPSCERSMIRAQSESGGQREGSTSVLGTRDPGQCQESVWGLCDQSLRLRGKCPYLAQCESTYKVKSHIFLGLKQI